MWTVRRRDTGLCAFGKDCRPISSCRRRCSHCGSPSLLRIYLHTLQALPGPMQEWLHRLHKVNITAKVRMKASARSKTNKRFRVGIESNFVRVIRSHFMAAAYIFAYRNSVVIREILFAPPGVLYCGTIAYPTGRLEVADCGSDK